MFKMDFFTIFHVNALNDVTISLVDNVASGKFWDCIKFRLGIGFVFGKNQWRSQPDNLVMLCKYFRVHSRENNQFLKKLIMIMI